MSWQYVEVTVHKRVRLTLLCVFIKQQRIIVKDGRKVNKGERDRAVCVFKNDIQNQGWKKKNFQPHPLIIRMQKTKIICMLE